MAGAASETPMLPAIAQRKSHGALSRVVRTNRIRSARRGRSTKRDYVGRRDPGQVIHSGDL